MKVKDLADYLARFDPGEDLPIIVIDPKARIRYPVESIDVIGERPLIGIEVSGSEPFTEVMVAAAEEDEMRMQEEQM